MDNEDRAYRAYVALYAYRNLSDVEGDDGSVFQDLIADLLHAARLEENAPDTDAIIRMAVGNFEAEIE